MKQVPNAAATALMTVMDVPCNLVGTGIQLQAVRRENHETVRRHFDVLAPDQMVAHFDKKLLYPHL